MLTERGALVGASDHGSTKALYAHDPDGIEFEVSWLVPADLLDPDRTMRHPAAATSTAEIERYGADTRAASASRSPTRLDSPDGDRPDVSGTVRSVQRSSLADQPR